MWYFSWILGVGLAVGFGVLNGLWHEFHLFDEGDEGQELFGEPTPEAPAQSPSQRPAAPAVA